MFMEKEKLKQKTAQEEEEESTAEDEGIPAELEENITSAIKTAKITNKKIKSHMKFVSARQNQLNSRYDSLIMAVTEREDEICKIVHNLCQNFRDIIEHDRKQMHTTYQEELQSAKESKWFLCTCYQKFKEILSSDNTPGQLVLMQLDATVAQIANEEFQVPKWSVPHLETVPRSQEDKFTIHSLIGNLMINRKRESTSQAPIPRTISATVESDDNSSYHTGREVDEQDSNSDSDPREEDLASLLETVAVREEEPKEEVEEEEEEERGEDEDVTEMTGHCHRRGLLGLRRRRKKNRKRVEIGCALLKEALLGQSFIAASIASPSTASGITCRRRSSVDLVTSS